MAVAFEPAAPGCAAGVVETPVAGGGVPTGPPAVAAPPELHPTRATASTSAL
ncbi:MAG TPA: hypothetical protein VJR89_02495 [Polyangiales bacterium]|nr:hypothetical protein [Polyangiales bacterium]